MCQHTFVKLLQNAVGAASQGMQEVQSNSSPPDVVTCSPDFSFTILVPIFFFFKHHCSLNANRSKT